MNAALRKKYIMDDRHYILDVSLYKDRFIKVNLLSSEVKKILDFANKLTKKESKIKEQKRDLRSFEKRHITGKQGEVSIEKIINIPFTSWKISSSKDHNHPDLKSIGLNVGVKTARDKHYPLIHKIPEAPEIICIAASLYEVYVCGYASIEVLRKYQDDSLILDPEIRRKGIKTGFYGFHALRPFKSYRELYHLVNNNYVKLRLVK